MLTRALARSSSLKLLPRSSLSALAVVTQKRPIEFTKQPALRKLGSLSANLAMNTQSGFTVPQGWSDKDVDLAEAKEDFPKGAYKLNKDAAVKPILADEGPAARFLVGIDGGYYVWNSISDGVWKVKAPTTLKDIFAKLSDPQLKGITLEDVARAQGPGAALGKLVTA